MRDEGHFGSLLSHYLVTHYLVTHYLVIMGIILYLVAYKWLSAYATLDQSL